MTYQVHAKMTINRRLSLDISEPQVELTGTYLPGGPCGSTCHGHGPEQLYQCDPAQLDDVVARDDNGNIVGLTDAEEERAYEALMEAANER